MFLLNDLAAWTVLTYHWMFTCNDLCTAMYTLWINKNYPTKKIIVPYYSGEFTNNKQSEDVVVLPQNI